jgi:outer membrane protein assembly factor BamB
VALYRGKVYVGTLDGRLIALDEHSGAPVWSVSTADSAKPYAISSAPRIAKGMVVIGNAGSEYGVRGYISAYDAETGKMAWRSTQCPAIQPRDSNRRPWKAPPKPGPANGGRPAEAALSGKGLSTTLL